MKSPTGITHTRRAGTGKVLESPPDPLYDPDMPPILVRPDWYRSVVLEDGNCAILFYDDGTVRFGHRCDRGDRGIVIVAPLLPINTATNLVSNDPLTIFPSIKCTDCGLHGWVRDGAWISELGKTK